MNAEFRKQMNEVNKTLTKFCDVPCGLNEFIDALEEAKEEIDAWIDMHIDAAQEEKPRDQDV